MKRKLDACIKLETLIGDIYRDLGAMFPQARTLFDQLASEEDGHAALLARIDESDDISGLPEGFFLKITSLLTEPLLLAHILKDKIGRRVISLQEALELAIKLERSGAEQYFQASLLQIDTQQVKAGFDRFQANNLTHASMIQDFLSSL